MREYKFRAWDKRKEKFRDDVYIDSDGNLYEFSKKTGYGTAISYLNDEYIDVTQYTGLVDINGKEIYEGDILNCREYECFGKIEWNDEGAGFYFNIVLEGGGYEEESLYDYLDEVEVIGNIYENPELIKGRQ